MTLSLAAARPAHRITFVAEGEYTLCFLDFANLHEPEEALAAIQDAKEQIADAAPFSLRVLTDITGSQMSLGVIGALFDLGRANEPYVARSAVFGLTLPHRVALRQIRRWTGRDIREFDSRDDALAYLRS